MSNPNADRIAALSRQSGTPEANAIAVVASQYLVFAMHEDEDMAAALTIDYAYQWLDILSDVEEPSAAEQERALALQNLLSSQATPASQRYPVYREPLLRLLVAVAESRTANPNPTPAFGSR